MDNSLKKQLGAYQDEIQTAMDAFFVEYDTKDLSAYGLQAWELLTEFTKRPGKRIRGSLCIHTYKMFGGSSSDEILKVAVAIELIQNYLLIVDDVMDRSMKRRGKPAIHIKYRGCLLYTSPSPRDATLSRMPSSA